MGFFKNLTTPPVAANGGHPVACATAPCPLAVSVEIFLAEPVACPGHPLWIIAVGNPAGGTYSWTAVGGELVDADGEPLNAGNAVFTGGPVFLRGFKADDATGKIPEQTVHVKVQYTHPNGTANKAKLVKIHKIDFEVHQPQIMPGVTQANEDNKGVELGAPPESATIRTDPDPKVQIMLDRSCPRSDDCARNHQAGWLQTVVTGIRRLQYADFVRTVTVPNRIRDSWHDPDPIHPDTPPFYYEGFVRTFSEDGDSVMVHHEDSPRTPALWVDKIKPDRVPPQARGPEPLPAGDSKLRSIAWSEGFTAWLVVQNIEWSRHDLPGSLAYQKHFDWSMQLNVTVDQAKAVHHRCSPHSQAPTIGPVRNGKGSSNPTLTGLSANDSHAITDTPNHHR
jgi:hypothetical protein